jgi:cellulose synthase/poly-beta-1,6-N-acetylglucosamine synthase-like glycosyltransferase
MSTILQTIYLLILSSLSIYGLLGLLTLWLYMRHRNEQFPPPPYKYEDLPLVTVQLPIYNERFVVKRLIRAVVQLEYPRDRLHIQVIDDSTDDTSLRAAECVARYRDQGFDIQHIRREHRNGYKAGALARALDTAKGEFLAMFDADFEPTPDFLLQTIPHFLHNERLGMVQGRWGHLNDRQSPLTAVQAIALDKDFAMEQTVRHRADLFPKFNGAGGVWRRACILDAGGWQADTVTEDLDLSTRAILHDWEFLFLNNVIAPAELPPTISAFKSQQARWSKGYSQCLIKLGRPILQAKRHSLIARLYALISMSAYINSLFVLIILLLQLPLILLNVQFPDWMVLYSIAGIGQPLLYLLGQVVLYADWPRRLRYLPALLLIAVGLVPTVSRATLQAFVGHRHPFVRTPKGITGTGLGEEERPYRLQFDKIIFIELLLTLYAVAGILLAIRSGNFGPLLFLTLCAAGLGLVATLSLRDQLHP